MTRARLVSLGRLVIAVAVVVAVAIALWRNWSEVASELTLVDPWVVAGAAITALLSPVFTMLGWRALLRELGTDLSLASAASVFFVGQLGKYVPGTVWSVVVQADMGSQLGVPRARMAVTGLLGLLLSLLTGVLVGVPAVPLALAAAGVSISAWWAVPVSLVVALALWPRLINMAIGTGLRLLRHEPLPHLISSRAITQTLAWFALAWVSAGAAVTVLASTFITHIEPLQVAMIAVCGFALASAVGMVSFVTPAGLGVRDGVLAILLSSIIPIPAAAAVVVLARFITVVDDVFVAGVGWLWAKSHHLLGGASANGQG